MGWGKNWSWRCCLMHLWLLTLLQEVHSAFWEVALKTQSCPFDVVLLAVSVTKQLLVASCSCGFFTSSDSTLVKLHLHSTDLTPFRQTSSCVPCHRRVCIKSTEIPVFSVVAVWYSHCVRMFTWQSHGVYHTSVLSVEVHHSTW